jgi:hypothetical protein
MAGLVPAIHANQSTAVPPGIDFIVANPNLNRDRESQSKAGRLRAGCGEDFR